MDKYINAITAETLAGSGTETSAAFSIYGAGSVMLTMKKTGNATSVTFTVYMSPDGVSVDTEPFQTFTIAGAGTKQLTRPLTVGAGYVVIKAANGDAVNACVVTAQLTPVYGAVVYR